MLWFALLLMLMLLLDRWELLLRVDFEAGETGMGKSGGCVDEVVVLCE